MPNRILRAELLESDPWLTVNNACRSAWIACVLTVDNFGDMPAGIPRLRRLWSPYGIDSLTKVKEAIGMLAAVDLIREYEVDGKPYLHIPRFNQRLRHCTAHFALSPWATDEERHVASLTRSSQGTAAPRSAAQSGNAPPKRSEVKGSEKNRSEGKNPKVAPPALPDWIKPELWAEFRAHRARLRAPLTAYAEKLAIKTLTELRDGGSDTTAIIEQSIEKGWKGLFRINGTTPSGAKVTDKRAAVARGHFKGGRDDAPRDITGDSTRLDDE